MSRRPTEVLPVLVARAGGTNTGSADQVLQVVSPAFWSGPVSRTELLAAAVAAHAPTPVLDALLHLPERCYDDLLDLQGQLMMMTT